MISLVAISGLGSHAFGSFKERGCQHMWLRDALLIDLQGVRVLIYGIDRVATPRRLLFMQRENPQRVLDDVRYWV
jgi:hypothetical protein